MFGSASRPAPLPVGLPSSPMDVRLAMGGAPQGQAFGRADPLFSACGPSPAEAKQGGLELSELGVDFFAEVQCGHRVLR